MMRRRVYSKYSRDALGLLGRQIRLGRKKKSWTEAELAERAGIARATLQKIERGAPGCAIGLVFEVAVLVGLRLFDPEAVSLDHHIAQADNTLALLPKKVHRKTIQVDDDF